MKQYNYLGKAANQRRWTLVTLECYERGCNCRGCIYDELLLSCKCQCKAAVLELVKKNGAPIKQGKKRI